MSEQVIKTVENVDKLFSQIIVNGETFISDKVVEQPKPVVKPSTKTETTTTTSTAPKAPKASRAGEDVYAVDLNDVLHNFTDRTTKQNLTEEIRNRTEKDTAMQTELNTVKSSLNTVKASVEDIQALIPNQATKDNQLADKDFVNSSISTNTANFLGTFNTLEEIEALTDVTNNDYAFWKTTDTLGSVVFKRYKYIADGQEWKFEYDLNNSSFTAEQWEAINSGITAELVAKIGDGSAIVPSITEAEYEEIPNKKDGQIREITDAPDRLVPFATLNDTLMTASNVLSALKIKSMIDAVKAVIDTIRSYSTEETIVGTWIDGKPIYRKVFTDPNNSWSAHDNIIGNITNFKEPTSIKAIAFNDMGLSGWVENNEAGESRCYAYIKSNGEVHFYRNNVRDGTSYPKKVIIEYTKTTD